MEQMLILVDHSDEIVGYAPRSTCHRGTGKLHRAITVFLFNSQGEVLLQRRKSRLWDGHWDIAGATHPLHYPGHDESYAEAGARCLQTEWGVRTPLEHVVGFTYYARFHRSCESEYCVLLAGHQRGIVQMNPDYAYDLCWMNCQEFQRDIAEQPSLYTPWACIAAEKFFAHPLGHRLSASC